MTIALVTVLLIGVVLLADRKAADFEPATERMETIARRGKVPQATVERLLELREATSGSAARR